MKGSHFPYVIANKRHFRVELTVHKLLGLTTRFVNILFFQVDLITFVFRKFSKRIDLDKIKDSHYVLRAVRT